MLILQFYKIIIHGYIFFPYLNLLFQEKFKNLTKTDIKEIFNEQEIKEVTATTLVDLLIEVGAAKSKREAREFITSGAIKVNGEKNTSIDSILKEEDYIEKEYIIIKRGKKNYYLGKRKK